MGLHNKSYASVKLNALVNRSGQNCNNKIGVKNLVVPE